MKEDSLVSIVAGLMDFPESAEDAEEDEEEEEEGEEEEEEEEIGPHNWTWEASRPSTYCCGIRYTPTEEGDELVPSHSGAKRDNGGDVVLSAGKKKTTKRCLECDQMLVSEKNRHGKRLYLRQPVVFQEKDGMEHRLWSGQIVLIEEKYDLMRCKYEDEKFQADVFDEMVSTKNVFCNIQEAEECQGGRRRKQVVNYFPSAKMTSSK